MKKLREKLTDTGGETLAEVLVASLIAGIGLLLLATMILSSQKLMDKSTAAMADFYQGTSKIENSAADAKQEGAFQVQVSSENKVPIPGISAELYKSAGIAAYRPAASD